MRPGEIYLALFPFGDVPGMKLRPVLTLSQPLGKRPEVLVAYISSVVPPTLLPSDLLLDPFRPELKATKLKVVSALRLHKLATIPTSNLARRLGTLAPSLIPEISRRLRVMLNF